MRGTSSKAAFGWARQVGGGGQQWKAFAEGLPSSMQVLLAIAFGAELRATSARGRAVVEMHDRAVAIAAVLSGFGPEVLARRAVTPGRTPAFAVAAAWAVSVGDRDPETFQEACRAFRRVREEHEDGIAAGLLGVADLGRGPLYQQSRRFAREALGDEETWAAIGCLRAERSREDGRQGALAGTIDALRLLHDGGYRLGVRRGDFIRERVPAGDVAMELASIRAACRSGRSPSA